MNTPATGSSPRHRWLIVLAVTVLFTLPAALSLTAGRLQTGVMRVGATVPAFDAQTLNGNTVVVDDFTGRVTVLNFWATWCGPCRAEMPLLDAAHAPDEGVVVLAVNNAEAQATVADFATTLGLTLPILLDPGGRLQHQFGVVGYPTTVFVAPDGTVSSVHAGVLTAEQLTAFITVAEG